MHFSLLDGIERVLKEVEAYHPLIESFPTISFYLTHSKRIRIDQRYSTVTVYISLMCSQFCNVVSIANWLGIWNLTARKDYYANHAIYDDIIANYQINYITSYILSTLNSILYHRVTPPEQLCVVCE